MYAKVGSFGKILAKQPISIFIRSPLPWALRVTEVHEHIGGNGKRFMSCQLLTAVPGKRLA